MTLAEYKRKRNFRKTPEPQGGGTRTAPGLQYVIQKHDASRLHYDFRLELDGTLKSWAIPKGPSLDPSVKSLAVQVEDHPLEYAAFEGVIPEGEYGGGTVMVWDRGTWEPEEDAEQGYNSGKLKFILHGEKLHGSWALVRMGGRAGKGGKNWLLIKHRDKAAKPIAKFDVLKRKPRSVLSDRDLDEIAADTGSVWTSNGQAEGKSKTMKSSKTNARTGVKRSGSKGASRVRSRKSVGAATDIAPTTGARKKNFPAGFQPQLATLTAKVPEGDDWIYELKFDGYRILSLVRGGKVRLVTRRGKNWTARFRPIADAVADLKLTNAILDGEVVSLDEHGVSNFQQLQNLMKQGDKGSLVYYAFDLPYCDGYDLTETPLVERKALLARIVLSAAPHNNGRIRFSDEIRGAGEKVLQKACRAGMEGIVAKLGPSGYHQYRSRDWLKIKCHKQQEFVIGGFTKPEGARVGFGALLVGYYDDGNLIYAGKVGTGFTTESLRELTAALKKHAIEESPFKNPPKGFRSRGVTWVKPELVGEIVFSEWTSDGRLRQPSFQGLREDKAAREVVREMPKVKEERGRRSEIKGSKRGGERSKEKHSMPAKASTADETTIGGVRITHPDRVLYPESGITKREIAEYYERVAEWVLPYVVNRPLTLVRCPEGIDGECFFQKHLTGTMPDVVHGIDIKEKGKQEKYVGLNDLAGLIWLVQIGVLELHPWPAREDNVERPDFFVFDLDPGEGVAWKDVIRGAHDLRERLESVGLQTFLRTSGGKGLHVVVPIDRRTTWDDFKQFAKSVADAMTRDFPERYLATMSKAKRHGKIFVDYLRNQRGATAIACYSTRRRPGAPVATPIAWDELSGRLRPDAFNIKNLPKRLNKLKDDPWADFFTIRQSLNAKILHAFE